MGWVGALMRLFGNHKGPHLAHFRAHREHDHVELCWEPRNAVGVRWRVLRSKRGFATEPRALPGNGQTVVMEGTETHLRDAEIVEGGSYYYTVFVQDAQGDWHRQVKAKLGHHEHLRWLRPSRAGSAFGTDLTGNVSQRGRDAAESLVLKHERGGRG